MIIMMNKYNENKGDEKIGKLISSAKMKAPNNLKYRIMHQIEYENSLNPVYSKSSKKARKENGSVLKDLGSIFGTMYAVIAFMTITAYLIKGTTFYMSAEFWAAIVFVGFVFSLFWLVSRLDVHLKSKRKEVRNTKIQH